MKRPGSRPEQAKVASKNKCNPKPVETERCGLKIAKFFKGKHRIFRRHGTN